MHTTEDAAKKEGWKHKTKIWGFLVFNHMKMNASIPENRVLHLPKETRKMLEKAQLSLWRCFLWVFVLC